MLPSGFNIDGEDSSKNDDAWNVSKWLFQVVTLTSKAAYISNKNIIYYYCLFIISIEPLRKTIRTIDVCEPLLNNRNIFWAVG